MRTASLLVAVAGGVVCAAGAAYAGWRYLFERACRQSALGSCNDPQTTYFLVLGPLELAVLALAAVTAFSLAAAVLYRVLRTDSGRGPAA